MTPTFFCLIILNFLEITACVRRFTVKLLSIFVSFYHIDRVIEQSVKNSLSIFTFH